MKKLIVLSALAAMLASGTALADTSGKKIDFPTTMPAIRGGRRCSTAMASSPRKRWPTSGWRRDIFTTADKEVPTQAAQVQNLILQGYDAIVINAASPDALNGAIKQACDAGIVVVSFDGTVTEPCAYRVVVDFKDMASRKSNRWPSSSPRAAICWNSVALPAPLSTMPSMPASSKRCSPSRVQDRRLGDRRLGSDHPRRRRVATILPSLPDVVGIVDQGGDGYGAAQAFAAAGKPRPTIIMGNRQDELQWWKEQKDKDGYQTCRFDRARRVVARLLGGAAGARRPLRTSRTICWCRTWPSPKTISRPSCRRTSKGGVATTKTRRKTRSRPSKPTSSECRGSVAVRIAERISLSMPEGTLTSSD